LTTLLNVFPQLTNIDQEYIWGEIDEQAFEEFKVKFISTPILSNTYQPKFHEEFQKLGEKTLINHHTTS
jgi:hypothetical protein